VLRAAVLLPCSVGNVRTRGVARAIPELLSVRHTWSSETATDASGVWKSCVKPSSRLLTSWRRSRALSSGSRGECPDIRVGAPSGVAPARFSPNPKFRPAGGGLDDPHAHGSEPRVMAKQPTSAHSTMDSSPGRVSRSARQVRGGRAVSEWGRVAGRGYARSGAR